MHINVLFCHIPKCGGTSINDFLEKIPKKNCNYKWYTHRILKYDIEKYKYFYKFTVIRDPIDRLVSLYFYQENMIKTLYKTKELYSYQEGNWFKLYKLFRKYNIKNINTFLNKYEIFYNEEILPIIEHLKFFNEKINMNFFYKIGFLPQYLFVCDENKNIIVNDVVNINNINNFLNKKFGNYELKNLNIHSHTNENYIKYLSEDNISVIKKIYNDDYEIFRSFLI